VEPARATSARSVAAGRAHRAAAQRTASVAATLGSGRHGAGPAGAATSIAASRSAFADDSSGRRTGHGTSHRSVSGRCPALRQWQSLGQLRGHDSLRAYSSGGRRQHRIAPQPSTWSGRSEQILLDQVGGEARKIPAEGEKEMCFLWSCEAVYARRNKTTARRLRTALRTVETLVLHVFRRA
jgi:hypothetical protein